MVEAVSARIHGEDAWVLPLSTSLTVARLLDDISAAAAVPGAARRTEVHLAPDFSARQ
jgi:hypothetical protein